MKVPVAAVETLARYWEALDESPTETVEETDPAVRTYR
jgi:hypothetical protein